MKYFRELKFICGNACKLLDEKNVPHCQCSSDKDKGNGGLIKCANYYNPIWIINPNYIKE